MILGFILHNRNITATTKQLQSFQIRTDIMQVLRDKSGGIIWIYEKQELEKQ